MPLPVSLVDAIVSLGENNKTEKITVVLIKLLENCYDKCADDYKHTSTNQRYSTGKLERKIFLKLADICNWKNSNGNAKRGGDIMYQLGYLSYDERPNRFRQKVENEKKKHRRKNVRISKRTIRNRRRRNNNDMNDVFSDADFSYQEESNAAFPLKDSVSRPTIPQQEESSTDSDAGSSDTNSRINLFSTSITADSPSYDDNRFSREEVDEECIGQSQDMDSKNVVFTPANSNTSHGTGVFAPLCQSINDNKDYRVFPSTFF